MSERESAIAPDGTLRFLSPSQIKTFAVELDGCPRKWFIEKRLHIARPESEGGLLGTELHRHNEHWFDHGTEAAPLEPHAVGDFGKPMFANAAEHKRYLPRYWKAQALFRAGKHLLPPRGPELGIEVAIKDVKASGVPLRGYIDCRDPRPTPPKEDQPPDPPGTLTLHDWKTNKDPRRYGLTAAQLRTDVQMLAYAYSEGAEWSRLRHVYYNTQGNCKPFEVSTLIQLTTVKQTWHKIVDPIASKMMQVAKATKVEQVTPNLLVCDKFGGCPYKGTKECPQPSLGKRLVMGVLDSLEELEEAGTEEEAPAPPPKIAAPKAKAAPAPAVEEEEDNIEAQIAALKAQQKAKAAAKAAPSVGVLPPDAPPSDPELRSECPNCPGKQHKLADCPAKKLAEAATVEAPVEKKTRAKKEVTPDAPAEVASIEGLGLLVNAFSQSGPRVETLDKYIADRCAALAKISKVEDIRTGDDKSPLGYGKWRGFLAAMIRESPPKPAVYYIDGRTEIGAVVVEALAPMAKFVFRGER